MPTQPLAVIEPGASGFDALRLAIALAQESHGRLVIVRVSQCCPAWWSTTSPVSPPPPDPGADRQLLAAARDEVPADIPLQTQLMNGLGRTDHQVLQAAASLGCDAIIVNGTGSWIHRRLGIQPYLARHSRIPVLVARKSAACIERPVALSAFGEPHYAA